MMRDRAAEGGWGARAQQWRGAGRWGRRARARGAGGEGGRGRTTGPGQCAQDQYVIGHPQVDRHEIAHTMRNI